MSAKSVTAELTVVEARFEDVFSDMARLHLSHRPFARAGKVIVIKTNGKKAYAVARGASGNAKDSISLDSATREKLGVRSKQKATFTIQHAGIVDEFLWAWQATDAMPRVGARLGLLSLGLGIVGLVLGAASLCQ